MVKTRIGGSIAIINNYEWTCNADVGLERLLNSLLPSFGPEGDDPYPDLTEARRVVNMLGGEVIEVEAVEAVEGRVY